LFARARRSALTWAGAACLAVGLVALPSSTALAGTTSPSQEKFRATLGTYLHNLQGALTAASHNPQTKAVVAPHLRKNLKALAVARNHLPALNGAQLDAMQAILGQNPSWAEQPNVLRRALSQSSFTQQRNAQSSTSSNPPGIISDCSDFDSLGDTRGLFYSSWAATQAASAANAVASSLPDGANFTPALIVAGVAYGVANGLAIGLNDRLTRKLDCLAAQFNAELASAFPVQGSLDPNPGAYTRASSQASVDRLTTAAAGVDTTLNIIQTVINTTTAKLTVVINNLGLAQGNTDEIEATSQDLQTRSDDLLSSIGTPADQATYNGSEPSGTAHGLANTIDDRTDTILANTDSFKNLSVRIEIENALATNSNPTVFLFAIPASQGGYLEMVRDIVTTTIVNERAAGQAMSGDPQGLLASGNDALAAKNYEQAYVFYAQAYSHAVG
jgi:hypothetical protein